MRALLSSPGSLWPLVGIALWGTACGLPVAEALDTGLPWLAIACVPLGVIAYGVALVPAFAVAPPWAPHIASAVGVVALATVLVHRGDLTSLGKGRSAKALAGVAALWAAALALAHGGARYAQGVLANATLPSVLGEPSPGDLGLHALRVAMIARDGIPPRSPLDPDYTLQYRYLFHTIAAAFVVSAKIDTAAATAATSGLVLGAVALGSGALVWLIGRSWLLAVAGGALAGLSGPSYWLEEAAFLLQHGRWPTIGAFQAAMGDRWSLSPLSASYPTMLTSQGSSPGLPMAVLSWIAVLLCFTALATGTRWVRACALLAGGAFAALLFAADFFAPLALLGLLAGAAGLPRWKKTANRRPMPPRSTIASFAGGLVGGMVLLFGVTRQIGGAGAARNLRLSWNGAFSSTAVYGGNHALLAGGTPAPMPNWVYVHDLGMLFWPGLLLVLAAAWRARNPLLLAASVTTLATALFWQLFTVGYDAGTPIDLRVQMYRYVSLAAALLAPILPAALVALSFPSTSRRLRMALGFLLVAVMGVVGGAGLFLLAGFSSIAPSTPEQWRGDVVMSQRLAAEPSPTRLAIIGGPRTFLEMYGTERGVNVPLWWSTSQAAMPVGWDFGFPEHYQPLYQHVVDDFDAHSAAELRLTHIAVVEGQIAPERRQALQTMLSACGAQRIAQWPESAAVPALALFRISQVSCAAAR